VVVRLIDNREKLLELAALRHNVSILCQGRPSTFAQGGHGRQGRHDASPACEPAGPACPARLEQFVVFVW
jgi:hypothetical protein